MKKINKTYLTLNMGLLLLTIVIVSFMTYGFSHYSQLLSFEGNITIIPDGKLIITNIAMVDSSNVISNEIPTFTDSTINFDVTFEGTADEYYITYSADIINNSSYDYMYNGFELTPIVNSSNNGVAVVSMEITGIEDENIIAAKETISVNLTLRLSVDDKNQIYNTNGSIDINTNVQDGGELLSSLEIISNDLRGNNNLAEVKLSLINTFTKNINFSIASTNTNFDFVDSEGNLLTEVTIPANSTKDYTVYIRKSITSFFSTEQDSTIMKLICDTINNIIVGEVNLLVDITEIIQEDTPIISSIDINGSSVSGSNATIDVSWTGIYKGTADSYNYTVQLYNTRTNQVSEVIVDSDTYTYSFSVTTAGNYYAIVYGTASDGKTGLDYLEIEDSPYYKQSETVIYYSITIQFTNVSWSGPTFIKAGDTINGSYLSTTSSYTLPNDMTVYMGDKLLICASESDYWFTGRTARSGSFMLYTPANGDLKLIMVGHESSSGGCLVEGTKITLADGTTKNIENISYDDLLLVWNYETGDWTYEYPIWIEKPTYINEYTRITFSDGSILDVAINHGLYNLDLNLFVTINDNDNFKVGTPIAKFDQNNNLQRVTVTNIEQIYEKIRYYHIVSTRYYNVIANSILTTDDVVIVSNLYGFEDNAKWPDYRKYIIEDANNVYKYEAFQDFLPYYMFKGLRVEEGKILEEYLPLEEFKLYLQTNQANYDILSKPITDKNGNNIWMVTTSDDIVNENNKSTFMIQEGTNYKLKQPKEHKNFLYWYNTADGKKYNIGDNVEIWHGNHFIAIYNN